MGIEHARSDNSGLEFDYNCRAEAERSAGPDSVARPASRGHRAVTAPPRRSALLPVALALLGAMALFASPTVTIADDDAQRSRLSFASQAYRVDEGASVTLTVNISPPLASPDAVVVAWGEAAYVRHLHDSDYTVGGMTRVGADQFWLELPANVSSATFTLAAVADRLTEGDETSTFVLRNRPRYHYSPPPYDVAAGARSSLTAMTIVDTSTSPWIRLSAAPNPVAEGSPVTVTATLPAALAKDVTIRLRVIRGVTATLSDALVAEDPRTVTRGMSEDGDHGTLASIMVPAGSTSASGTIATSVDEDGDDEMFTVAVDGYSVPPGLTAGTLAVVQVTITDTSPTVRLSASPNVVAEGSPVTVTATLSEALAEDVSIPVTLTRGTAEPGDIGALASIAIPVGSTSGTGTVATARDGDADDETFTVALGSLPPPVAAGTPSSVTVTIADTTGGGGESRDDGTGGGEPPDDGTGGGEPPDDGTGGGEPGGGEPPDGGAGGGGGEPGGGATDPPDTGASATPVVGRRARAIDSPYCFVPGAGELDALGGSTHLAYRLDGGKDFDLCLWDADENWRDAPAYASCRGAGGVFPRRASHPEPGGEPGAEPAGEKTLSAERAAGLMACVVPTGGEGGDWLLRVAPDNPETENPAPENPE